MAANVRNDTATPTAGQRPADLYEAIDLLCYEPGYRYIDIPRLSEFVNALIDNYPHLVMERVLVRRTGSITEALREYRGEV